MTRFVPIIIQVKGDREAEKATREITNAFKQMGQEGERSAKTVNSSFATYFNAQFFAQIARDAFYAFINQAKQFITQGIQLAQDLQNALLGVSSVAAFKGIDSQSAQSAIQNLTLVKAGIVTVSDASVGLKNLLQAGFGLDQSVTLLERFSDSAAFGKQAALSYGEAIRSATEGIKNQNSILVDNAGITKNIEVILKERGFTMQDLSDKQKGVNAREALYKGLLAESAAQLGDSEKLINTYTGAVAAQTTAYQNLERTIGGQIIRNAEWVEATKITAEFLNKTTDAVKDQNSETAKFVNSIIHYAALIKATLPSVATGIYQTFKEISQTVTGLTFSFHGSVLRVMEILVQTVTGAGATIVNTISSAINKALSFARQIPASLSPEAALLGKIPDMPIIPTMKADFGSQRSFELSRQLFEGAQKSRDRGFNAYLELKQIEERLDRAANRAFPGAEAAFGNRRAGVAGPDTAGAAGGGGKGKIDNENIRDARKVFEQQQGVVDRYIDGIEQLKVKVDDYNVSTHEQAEKLAYAKIKTDEMTQAQKVLIDQAHAMRLVNAKILDQMDATNKAKAETAKADEFLQRQIQSNMEIQRQLSGVNDEALSATDALNQSIISYGKAIASATPAIMTAAQAEAARTTAMQQGQRVAEAARETAMRAAEEFARSPLGQAQAEYNHLLEEQRGLNDPILQQQTLQNELLRNKINLQLLDRDAVIASGRAQLELADKTVYHATQANASVLEFLARTKSVTEIVADAKIGVIQTTFDVVDRGLSKWTDKLGIVGGLVKQLISDFARLWLLPAFLRLFGLQPNGGQGGNGGGGGIVGGLFGGGPGGTPTFAGGPAFGGGGGGGSLFQRLVNSVRGGNPAHYASGLPFLGNLSSLGGGGIEAPTATLSTAVNGGLSASVLHEVGHSGAAAAAAPGIFSGIGFGLKPGSGGALSMMLPLLGASLGMQLGGQSRFGNILGGVGGLALGAGLTAAPSALAGTFLAPLFSNPITAIVGGALLVGAVLAGISAKRRKNETDRAALNNDTYSQVIQVLNDARAGRYDSAGAAIAAFDQIKSSYFSRIAGYDSKTKRIATDVWNDTKNGFEVYRPMIKAAAEAAAVARVRSSKLVPEFVYGGSVSSALAYARTSAFAGGGFMGRVPGMFDGRDNHLIRVSGDEVVLNPRQWKPIAPYLKAARVPGFSDGGSVSGAGRQGAGAGSIEISIDRVEIDADGIVFKGLKSSDNRKVVIKTVRAGQVSGQL